MNKKILLKLLAVFCTATCVVGMASCNDSNHSSSSSSSGSSIGQQLPTTPSEGLTYALNADGVSYSVTGVGTCTDAMVVIPSTYSELPVTAIAKKSV